MEVTKTKQEVNQQILFELFLREKFENNNHDKIYNGLKEKGHNVENFKCLKDMLMECKCEVISLKDLTRFIDMSEDFEKYKSFTTKKNYAKEFFDWAKKKAVEMGMPKNTFKTIWETGVVARNMIIDWYIQFKTTEELVNWFNQENDIMLK